LPLLWRDDVIGWANVAAKGTVLISDCGFIAGHRPRERAFGRALEREVAAMRDFLGL
jgi:hypothetical protein